MYGCARNGAGAYRGSTVRPRLLDVFSGAGGCSVGYHRAGYDVVGIDNEPHPDYPYVFLLGDAIAYLEELVQTGEVAGFRPDVVHASPPCKRFTDLAALSEDTDERHPDLLTPTRELLQAWGGTYVIENVEGAPMRDPLLLCGSEFGLGATCRDGRYRQLRRHRLFESNAFLMGPGCWHNGQQVVGVYGAHPDREGGWLRPNGMSRGVKATSVADAQDALGIDWMTQWEDLADAIPPAMTEHIGDQLLSQLAMAA